MSLDPWLLPNPPLSEYEIERLTLLRHYPLTIPEWRDLDEYEREIRREDMDHLRALFAKTRLYRHLRSIAAEDRTYCASCGEREPLVIDHVKPMILGGSCHPMNLQLLCTGCNGSKGADLLWLSLEPTVRR